MIGKRLRELRDCFGLTQAEMAERLGVVAKRINRWETDAVEPRLTYVRRICDEFDTSADWLLGLSPYETDDEDEA